MCVTSPKGNHLNKIYFSKICMVRLYMERYDSMCSFVSFYMQKIFNSVFCFVISTKALSNLSYFQHHILTRQREESFVGGTLK